MKTKFLAAIAILSMASLPAFARRVVRPGHPGVRPVPPVVRPIPAPGRGVCDIHRIQRISDRLTQEARTLTQETRRLVGRGMPKTRAARQFTEAARYFADVAYSSVRCRRVRAEFPYLRRQMTQLRQAFLNGRPVGYPGYGYPPHRPHRPGYGYLQQQLETVERVFGRLRRNVMQPGHRGPIGHPGHPGRPLPRY